MSVRLAKGDPDRHDHVMRGPSAARRFEPYSPAWADECPCGSGKSFGACCRSRLPGFDIGKAYHAETEAGRWGAALLHVRADICQYVIWHRRHTRPGVFRGPMPTPSARDLLSIDVDACGFRADPATHSDLMPPPVPI